MLSHDLYLCFCSCIWQLNHSIGGATTSVSLPPAFLALWVLFIPGLGSFSFFYHLLSIWPYIFSSRCCCDCGCNHCCVFFSFSSCGLTCSWSQIVQGFSSLIYKTKITTVITAIPSKVARLSAFKAAITSVNNVNFTLLFSYEYCPG